MLGSDLRGRYEPSRDSNLLARIVSGTVCDVSKVAIR